MKRSFLVAVGICIVFGGALVVTKRVAIKEFILNFTKPDLPQEKTVTDFSKTDKYNEPRAQEHPPLPSSVNLKIPFGSQAPFANWDMPYQEACEEATAIMAHYYFTGQKLDPATMDKEILKLVKWQGKTFGYYKDTTAEEIARIMRDYFGHTDVAVHYDFDIDELKAEVAAGYPVILPAAGRMLANPNFRRPGPLYHALVVKGYTSEKIITNDPGTRNGRDYLYSPETIINAAHEWNPADILQGRRVMIVVRQ